ncbi:MAG: hypothetical protein LBK82_10500, partial [Planctomycetaceae bacterium]|nr:hypothetical protein [Planctomycetaceae bacterium]
MRTLTFTTIFLFFVAFVRAIESDHFSEDDIALLKKRLEVAKANAEDSDIMYKAGNAQFGSALDNARANLDFTKAKINLYRATGEKIQLINALEEQLKWANYFHAAVKAKFSVGGMQPKELREAALVVYEVELELKKAKQEKTNQKTIEPDHFSEGDIELLKKRLEVGGKLLARNWDAFNHAQIEKLIKEYGNQNRNYDKTKPPYAVFDWDNTCIFLDIEEATFA